MPDDTFWPDGSPKDFYDDTAMIHTSFNEDGTVSAQEEYTPEERAPFEALDANRQELIASIGQQVPKLLDSVTAMKDILAQPDLDDNTKQIARELRTVARALVQVTRVLGDVVDSTSTG